MRKSDGIPEDVRRPRGQTVAPGVGSLAAAAESPDAWGVLSRSLGNAAVARLVEGMSAGEKLDNATNQGMSQAFGTDLGEVRLHHDSDAGELTRGLSARAFTVGRDVFFAPGAYDTHSEAGRETLGHELTHVVQSKAGGAPTELVSSPGDAAELEAVDVGRAVATGRRPAVPLAGPSAAVMRQEDGASPAVRSQMDRLLATFEITTRTSYAGESNAILFHRATTMQERLDGDEAGPMQRVELALSLIEIERILTSRIGRDIPTSPYEAHPEPVVAAGSTSLAERPPFHRVDEWRAMVAAPAPVAPEAGSAEAAPAPAARERPAPAASARAPRGATAPHPAPEAEAAAPEGEAARPEPASPAQAEQAVAAQAQPAGQATEAPASPQGGGGAAPEGMPEVGTALAALRRLTLRDMARLGGTNIPGLDVETEPALASSLAEHTGHVLYLATRIYILDAGGAVQSAIDPSADVVATRIGGPEQFSVDISFTSMRPGAYFLHLFRPMGPQGPGVMMTTRVGGTLAPITAGMGDFLPTGEASGGRALRQLIQADLSSDQGVLIVVSNRTWSGPLGALELEANFQNIDIAVGRAIRTHLWPALLRQIQARIDNPWDTLRDQAREMAVEWISRRIPIIGWSIQALERLRTAAWLGRTLSVAVYARTQDEIDIAAQAIAERAADEIIDFFVEHARNAAAGAVSRARSDRRASERAARGEIEAPEIDEAQVEGWRERGEIDVEPSEAEIARWRSRDERRATVLPDEGEGAARQGGEGAAPRARAPRRGTAAAPPAPRLEAPEANLRRARREATVGSAIRGAQGMRTRPAETEQGRPSAAPLPSPGSPVGRRPTGGMRPITDEDADADWPTAVRRRPLTDEDADSDWPTAVRPRPGGRPAGPEDVDETTDVSQLPPDFDEDTPTLVEDPGVQAAPEGLVHIVGPSEADARESFRRSLEEDPSREAAIFLDPATGDYIVVQGETGMVEVEWLGRGGELRGRQWRLIEHNHPGGHVLARFASPQDFEAMMHFQNVGEEPPGPVTTTILWRDPRTNEELQTEIGYDPDLPEPFWIRYRDPQGDWQVETFADVPWNAGSDYEGLLRRFGYVPQAIPPRPGASAGARSRPPPVPPQARRSGGRR